jgi:8-oxo-dGTP diphosphatase
MDKEIKFRVCAVDPVIIKDGEVLMTKRSFGTFKGCWSLPGGKVDVGEDVKTACLREIKEETNLEVKIVGYLGYYDAPDRDPDQELISLSFLCEVTSGEPKHCDEATDIRWFPLDSLPEKIGWDHREIIDDAKRFLEENKS